MKRLLIIILLVQFEYSEAMSNVTCVGDETYVAWPDSTNPVWEMCYLSPNDSSYAEGSGLEIRYVHFNGYLAIERSHTPLVFANYTTNTCYRDWKDENSSFISASGVDNPAQSAITTCDASIDPNEPVFNCPFGLDGDCITGVQVEKYDDRLVLTTNFAAAWYKYTGRYIFHADGRIQPRFGYANNNGTLANVEHWHHSYWRINFDIDGMLNDKVYIADQTGETEQTSEFSDFRELFNATNDTNTYNDEVTWVIKDSLTNRGYRVVAGQGGVSANGGIDDYDVATDESGAGYHEIDVMASRYKLFPNGMPEYGDVPTSSLSDCRMRYENIVGIPGSANNEPESLVGEDVVFWYRGAINDVPASQGGAPMLCKSSGPTFYPVGDWGLGDSDLIFESGFE